MTEELDADITVNALLKEIDHEMQVTKEYNKHSSSTPEETLSILFEESLEEIECANASLDNSEKVELGSPVKLQKQPTVKSFTSLRSPGKFKEMVNDAYELESPYPDSNVSPSKDVVFSLKGTKPLLSYSASTDKMYTVKINPLAEDMENDDSPLELTQTSPQVRHSPSKIPITNIISINKFTEQLKVEASFSHSEQEDNDCLLYTSRCV